MADKITKIISGRLSVRIPKADLFALEKISNEMRVSLSDVVRISIGAFIDQPNAGGGGAAANSARLSRNKRKGVRR
jgi:hypothetical protein